MPEIICSKHSQQRFNERVTKKSKRYNVFATRAYYDGVSSEDISDKRLRHLLEIREREHGSVARVYRGFVYWFCGHTVTTVYPVPRVFRGAML